MVVQFYHRVPYNATLEKWLSHTPFKGVLRVQISYVVHSILWQFSGSIDNITEVNVSKSKQKKTEQLGMNPSTAQHRLRKDLMFSLIKECGLDTCFQCGDKITTVRELSIEHKVPWLDSENPIDLFFDLDNVAFSHLSCNCKESRGNLKYVTPEEKRAAKNLSSKKWISNNKEFRKDVRRRSYLKNGN